MMGNWAGGASVGVTRALLELAVTTRVGVRGNAGGTTGRATVS